MFNGVNLQRGNVFKLVFVIYIAIEIIMMSSIIKILKILLPYSPKMLPIIFRKVGKRKASEK